MRKSFSRWVAIQSIVSQNGLIKLSHKINGLYGSLNSTLTTKKLYLIGRRKKHKPESITIHFPPSYPSTLVSTIILIPFCFCLAYPTTNFHQDLSTRKLDVEHPQLFHQDENFLVITIHSSGKRLYGKGEHHIRQLICRQGKLKYTRFIYRSHRCSRKFT